jgi:hypothetical protein
MKCPRGYFKQGLEGAPSNKNEPLLQQTTNVAAIAARASCGVH